MVNDELPLYKLNIHWELHKLLIYDALLGFQERSPTQNFKAMPF